MCRLFWNYSSLISPPFYSSDEAPYLGLHCCQCPSPGFTDNPLSTALWYHSDKNKGAINNRYLDS